MQGVVAAGPHDVVARKESAEDVVEVLDTGAHMFHEPGDRLLAVLLARG
jgi:hypothetical protein